MKAAAPSPAVHHNNSQPRRCGSPSYRTPELCSPSLLVKNTTSYFLSSFAVINIRSWYDVSLLSFYTDNRTSLGQQVNITHSCASMKRNAGTIQDTGGEGSLVPLEGSISDSLPHGAYCADSELTSTKSVDETRITKISHHASIIPLGMYNTCNHTRGRYCMRPGKDKILFSFG